MYHNIIKHKIKSNFKALSEGNYTALLDTVHDNVEHQFLGDSPIGGKRISKEKLTRWFERVYRLFPVLKFNIKNIFVSGMPWNTKVAIEWEADVTPAIGDQYINTGVHIINIRWGNAVKIAAYENADLVAQACKFMCDNGIEEASADQIN
tara:strand:- start:208 stop:657 length:450 start_codon:yes stop_codon:yes gene_type:complete